MRTGLFVLAATALLTAGCGMEKDKEEAGKACGAAPTAIAQQPTLPSGFPTPSGVTYTKQSKAGPSTIVEGFRNGDLDSALEEYKSGIESATGYAVTKDEHDAADAEVNYSGGKTTGQIALKQECKDRTTIKLTIRPE
jgi:hypothetical protein